MSEYSNFWTSSREAYSSNYYELNVTGTNLNYPVLYMSMYAPMPAASMCNNGNYYYCRVYTQFHSRRYYLVARSSTTTNAFRFSGNYLMPQADDTSSQYYYTYIGYAYSEAGNLYYRHTWGSTRSTGVLVPSTPTYSYTPSLYGTNLYGFESGFIISCNMNGRTLYSNTREYGQYEGSFLRLTMSGTNNLYGCGVTLSNRPISLDAPFYCVVQGSNYLDIFARKDIAMTGTLYITLYMSSIPSTLTYQLSLYDKYISGSDYSRTVYVSQSWSRTASGYSLVQPTSINWRKQVYKEFRTDAAPIRFTFSNNYAYVYDYTTPGNSDALAIVYPGGISSSYDYSCFIKEYPPQQKHLYRSY